MHPLRSSILIELNTKVPSAESAMRYTVLLTPETDPNVYLAYVPVLGVVNEGATVKTALEAAQEAAYLELHGRLDDSEEVPVPATVS
jgi:predicted RNase H-like HicB family nuclease